MNSDGLKMARSVDPEGMRTMGVLTKVDIMDQVNSAFFFFYSFIPLFLLPVFLSIFLFIIYLFISFFQRNEFMTSTLL